MSPEIILSLAFGALLGVATLCGALYALPKIWSAWWDAKYAVNRTKRWIREERREERKDDDG